MAKFLRTTVRVGGFVLGVAALITLAGCSSDSDPADDLAATPTDAAAEAAADPTSAPPPTATEPPAPTPTPLPTPTPVPPRTTIDELLARSDPLNIAHAGGDQDSPHSTMFAFARAVETGVDMLELDVQLSADGVVVVHHDLTVEGTTGESGTVSELTLAELQQLDNAYWFAEECWPCRDLDDDAYLYRGVRTGDTAPPDGFTADDFRIEAFRDVALRFPELAFDIEIKGDPPAGIEAAEALAELLRELDMIDNVVVVSFNDQVIAAFEAAAPDVETSPATNELGNWLLADVPLSDRRIVQVPPFFEGLEVVNAEFIELAATAGVEVWVWPNDVASQENATFYAELIELGVDGILAGSPSAMASLTT